MEQIDAAVCEVVLQGLVRFHQSHLLRIKTGRRPLLGLKLSNFIFCTKFVSVPWKKWKKKFDPDPEKTGSETRAMDPDPHESAIILPLGSGFNMRIRIQEGKVFK